MVVLMYIDQLNFINFHNCKTQRIFSLHIKSKRRQICKQWMLFQIYITAINALAEHQEDYQTTKLYKTSKNSSKCQGFWKPLNHNLSKRYICRLMSKKKFRFSFSLSFQADVLVLSERHLKVLEMYTAKKNLPTKNKFKQVIQFQWRFETSVAKTKFNTIL